MYSKQILWNCSKFCNQQGCKGKTSQRKIPFFFWDYNSYLCKADHCSVSAAKHWHMISCSVCQHTVADIFSISQHLLPFHLLQVARIVLQENMPAICSAFRWCEVLQDSLNTQEWLAVECVDQCIPQIAFQRLNTVRIKRLPKHQASI